MRTILAMTAACGVAALAELSSAQARPAGERADRIRQLSRESAWRRVDAIPMQFPTHHPQGMVRIGDVFYVSSVEVTVRTKRFDPPVDGYDRDTGQGIGHLFQFDGRGRLIADLKLGEGAAYHPGGIDFDGQDIWVPVAEYRPNSRSIVYRVDPRTMKATEVFRFRDHIGAVVRDTDDNTLHGVSWGSRRFYRWTLDANGAVTNADAPPEAIRTLNPSHYVDYQDCKYAGAHRMVCTGVADMRGSPDAPAFRLGGIDLVDLRTGLPVHQVPLLVWAAGGRPMTQNAVWIEPAGTGLRGYFMPEDDMSVLYVYAVEAAPAPQ